MDNKINQRRIVILACALLLVLCGAFLLSPIGMTAFAESSEYKTVTIQYLERIGNSPFAKEVKTEVYIPVYANNQIDVKDVCVALGYKSFGVMQSYCDRFDYKDGIYVAYYYKSVYFKPITVDGNSPTENMYLDVNDSFQTFYKQFLDDGSIDSETYEYFWNKIHFNFPETANVKADELHGYWGFVSIPYTYSFNTLWKEVFGIEQTFQGVLDKIKVRQGLTYDGYQALLRRYNYSWLNIAWSSVAGFVAGSKYEADNYMLYVDSGVTEAFLADSGATNIEDEGGAIQNSVEGVVDWAGTLFDQVSEAGKIVMLVIGVMLLLVLLAGVIFLLKIFVFTPVKFLANTATKIASGGDSENRKKKRK